MKCESCQIVRHIWRNRQNELAAVSRLLIGLEGAPVQSPASLHFFRQRMKTAKDRKQNIEVALIFQCHTIFKQDKLM